MWMLYIFLCVFLFSMQAILNKRYQQNVPSSGISQALYLLVISMEAALLFFLLAKGDILGDPLAMQYGAVATLIVVGSMLSTLVCMGHMNLSVMTVSQNAGSLVLPTLYGLLVLNEPLTLMKTLGVLLVMAAFLIPFFFRDRRIQGQVDKVGIIATVGVFIFTGGSNIVHKAFTASEAVASNEAYLTWLNIFMIPVLLLAILVIRLRSGKSFKVLTAGIPFRYYLLVAAGVVLGCVGMVCSMTALSMVDVSIYSPLYASLFIIFITLVSRLVFKEKITKANYVSVGLAVAAVILSVL